MVNVNFFVTRKSQMQKIAGRKRIGSLQVLSEGQVKSY
jgi:hypothetical protein